MKKLLLVRLSVLLQQAEKRSSGSCASDNLACRASSMMDGIDLESVRQLAASAAYSAVDADERGDYEAAASGYDEAANKLLIVLDSGEFCIAFLCFHAP